MTRNLLTHTVENGSSLADATTMSENEWTRAIDARTLRSREVIGEAILVLQQGHQCLGQVGRTYPSANLGPGLFERGFQLAPCRMRGRAHGAERNYLGRCCRPKKRSRSTIKL